MIIPSIHRSIVIYQRLMDFILNIAIATKYILTCVVTTKKICMLVTEMDILITRTQSDINNNKNNNTNTKLEYADFL